MKYSATVCCLLGTCLLAACGVINADEGMVMEFVHVPAGIVEIANTRSGTHKERLDSFWIGRSEVTQGAYAVFLKHNADKKHIPLVKLGKTDVPITGVSWHSAEAFADWCGGVLPSRQQWLKAGYWNPSTGTRLSYPWGASDAVAYNRDKSKPAKAEAFPKDRSYYGALSMAGAPPEWVGKPREDGFCTAMGYYHREGRGQSYNGGHANKTCSFRIILEDRAVPQLPRVEQKRIADLVSRLGAAGHKERMIAEQVLIRYGALAKPTLRKQANTKDPEIRSRIAAILKIPGSLKLRFVPERTPKGTKVKIELVLPKDEKEATMFFKGGDISMLPRYEKLDAVFRDDGKVSDALSIMMKNGCNCFRVRLFVNPTGKGGVIQDTAYVVKLGQRIKKAGGVFLLDFHYSDTWADPGHQSKPKAWEKLSFKELEAKVESYTVDVMTKMKKAQCVPDIVQVGNEITPGFLWPDGRLGKEGNWEKFTTLLKAGIRGVKKPLTAEDKVKIMIHIDKGGSASRTKWFFTQVQKHKVEYDMIGLSYYPWWHGKMADLRANLKSAAETFKKPIVVVETAYPYRESKSGKGKDVKNLEYPKTPAGQKQFTQDILKTVRATPNGLGAGVMWWFPESIPKKGAAYWMWGRTALFDSKGDALPALKEFGTASK